MLRAGLRATVNSDDPSYFGGYVNANYQAVADALDLSKDDLVTLARNSFTGSLPRRRRQGETPRRGSTPTPDAYPGWRSGNDRPGGHISLPVPQAWESGSAQR